LTFNSIVGATYQIAVDGFESVGNIELSLSLNVPPSVNITAPASGATFTAPATIAVQVKALDSDGQIAGVAVYQDSTRIGISTTSPYAVEWRNVAPGTYLLTAYAMDNLGVVSTSAPVSVKVTGLPVAPSLVAQPQSQAVVIGAEALFSVVAEGTPPLNYQWKFNGADIPGAVAASLALINVQPLQAGNYTVVVQNNAGAATSQVARLEVLVPPVITSQPRNQSVSAGANVSFSVTAKGTAPLNYQWLFNGIEMLGATNASLVLANAQPRQAGNYAVVVRNNAGETSSVTVWLRVVAPVMEIIEPPNISRDDFWASDKAVRAIVETNGIIYLGGDFNYIGPNIGHGALISANTAMAHRGFPRVNGEIRAIASDGAGGWFIGGYFTAVGGLVRTNLARVRADLTVDADWAPNPNGMVRALCSAGGLLCVGGQFKVVGGQARTNLAVLEAATGAVTGWAPHPDGPVNALALSDNTLFLGGEFLTVDNRSRKRLAAVNRTDGTVTGWKPDANGAVFALAVEDEAVYVGGEFTAIGGEARQRLAALDALSGAATSWNPSADMAVQTLAVDESMVYVGGFFTVIGGVNRNFAAALDTASGTVLPWQPEPDNPVFTLVAEEESVYLGGDFTAVGGKPRNRLAQVDSRLGNVLEWDPSASDRVFALSRADTRILAGGRFKSVNGAVRRYLAALDAVTGVVTPWDPSANDSVNAIAVSANTVFVGGKFTQISGQLRSSLAALDLMSGKALAWQADANDFVYALAVGVTESPLAIGAGYLRSTLYVGGVFTKLGDQPRARIAAVDLRSGVVMPWDAGADDGVFALAVAGNTVYAGGDFTRIGGRARNRIAALDTSTGQLLDWNPDADGRVSALAVSGSIVYAGGFFEKIGGQARNRVAALDKAGDATAWNPGVLTLVGARNAVNALAVGEGMVYVGGLFSRLGNQARNNAGALSTLDAQAIGWNPSADREVLALWASGQTVYVGGNFSAIGGQFRPNFAAFMVPGAPVIVSQPQSRVLAAGLTNVTFSVKAIGKQPLAYQWQFNGADLLYATNATLILSQVRTNHSGTYAVVVSNPLGEATSAPAKLTVLMPPTIISQPIDRMVAPGLDVDLSVVAAGSAPLSYQWQRNGMNLPGATNSLLRLTNVQTTNAGSYRVIVANAAGTVPSDAVRVEVAAPSVVDLNDRFADRFLALDKKSGTVISSNIGATRELREPNHAGKAGGKSVWFTWKAPASGIATFSTVGSGFDTVLAVYTAAGPLGITMGDLRLVVSDEDSEEFFASKVTFNALAGTEYQIAIDGYGGAMGKIVLNWSLEETSEDVPYIRVHPHSVAVSPNAKVTLAVEAESLRPLTYQWFHYNKPIEGATGSNLVLSSVQRADVGIYSVRVSNPTRSVRSVPCSVEFGPHAEAITADKLQDATGSGIVSGLAQMSVRRMQGFASVTMGGLGTQIFDNFGSGTEPGEPPIGGVVSGASRWLMLQVATNGILVLDTIGSDIDTVMAVYTGTDYSNLHLEASDDNGAPDGIRSLVRLPVVPQDYLVVVAGVNGATGNIALNWKLGSVPVISQEPSDQSVSAGGNVSFGVAAAAVPAPSYQWRLDGMPIPGATNATLALQSVQPDDAGLYSVVVENFAGSRISRDALLSVIGGNHSPVLAAIPDQTVNEGSLLTFTITATDPETPAQTLVFSLDPGAPAGAGVDPNTGIFTWTPTEAQGPSTNLITARVTDNGSPPLSDARMFTVVVNEVTQPARLAEVQYLAGGRFQFILFGEIGARYVIEYSADLAAWTTLGTVTNVTDSVLFVDPSAITSTQRFYRARSP
jgi:hypothetical protein